MGQYYDFGDQVGPLLQQVLSRQEQAREFDAQQAKDYMEMQNIQKRHSESLAEQKRGNDLSNSRVVDNNRATAIGQLQDDLIEESQLVSVLGQGYKDKVKGMKSVTAEEASAPYGATYGTLLPKGNYYDAKSINLIKAQMMQDQQLAKLEASLPKNLPGMAEMPGKTIVGKNQQMTLPLDLEGDSKLNERQGNYSSALMMAPGMSPGGFHKQEDKSFMAKMGDKEMRELVLQKYPMLKLNETDILEYDATNKQVKITPSDSEGLPSPIAYSSGYDAQDVKRFMEGNGLKKMIEFVSKAKGSELAANKDALIDAGGQVLEIVSQHPEYASKVRPLTPWFQGWMQKQQEKQLEMQNRTAIADRNMQVGIMKKFAFDKNTPEDTRMKMQEGLQNVLGPTEPN